MKLTKKERKKCAADFRKAAKLLSQMRYYYCCSALPCWISRSLFYELFKKDATQLGHHSAFWFRACDEDDLDPEVIQRRVLGLELAAFLIKTGEFPWE